MPTPEVIPHGTPEWVQARVGCWTASRAPALMDRKRDGAPSQRCMDLIAEVVAERTSGAAVEHYTNAAMQRGLDLEPDALSEYSLRVFAVVEPGGLIVHPTVPRVAATPDGFVLDGLVETKCPQNMSKHLAALVDAGAAKEGSFADRLRKIAPAAEYADQVQWQMWVTGRPWCDLVSYDPRFAGERCLAVTRIHADAERHAAFAEAVTWAEAQVAEALEAVGDAA